MVWNRRCVVRKCPRNNPANVKPNDLLHRLPSNDETRKRWVELLGIEGEDAADHYKNVVCTLHFEAEKYHSTTCVLLKDVYNQSNTCTKVCSKIPKGVFPIRFCPPVEVKPSSSSAAAIAVSSSQASIDTINDDSPYALNGLIKIVPGKG
jgi:THAP domain